jgi:hypothetical protein
MRSTDLLKSLSSLFDQDKNLKRNQTTRGLAGRKSVLTDGDMNTIHIEEEEQSHEIDTKSSKSQEKKKAHKTQNVTFGAHDDEEESSFKSDESEDESDFSVLNKKQAIK